MTQSKQKKLQKDRFGWVSCVRANQQFSKDGLTILRAASIKPPM